MKHYVISDISGERQHDTNHCVFDGQYGEHRPYIVPAVSDINHTFKYSVPLCHMFPASDNMISCVVVLCLCDWCM